MVCGDSSYEKTEQSFVCSEAMVDKGASEWKDLGSDFWTLAIPIELAASFVNQLKIRGPSSSILPSVHSPPLPQYLEIRNSSCLHRALTRDWLASRYTFSTLTL